MPDDTPRSTSGEIARIFRRLGPAGPLAIASAVMPGIGGVLLLYWIDPVGQWLRGHQEFGLALYTVAFAVLSGLALLPTYAQAILGGWAFGFAWGFPGALVGFAGGSLIGYFVARRASGGRVVELIQEQPKWQAVYDALLGEGFWRTLGLVTLLRIPPNSPFAITNLVMAATRVPLVAFIIGTVVGMAPRTGVAVYLAVTLEDLAGAKKPWWMFVTSIICAVIILAIIGHISNRAIARVTNQQPEAASQTPPVEQ
ncbi:MAG: TVP38/TMEM64 family protein [Phycisphaerae bacterium]|nr:TVP38/TMEM64 family protein [Phycisphaerae bacterium]